MLLVRKLVLLVLLAIVPIQAMAAVAGSVTCVSDGHAHDSHGASHAGDDHGVAGHSHHDESTSGASDAAGHQGCHLVFSGLPVSPRHAAPSDLPVFQTTLSLLATLFIPESPQRPPRA